MYGKGRPIDGIVFDFVTVILDTRTLTISLLYYYYIILVVIVSLFQASECFK